MKRIGASVLFTLVVVVSSTPARAQSVIAPTEQLAFDRPESWALQYFTSATFLAGLGATTPEPPGSIAIQLEAGWLPRLTAEQERVGFAGTAGEDLNKAPLFFRPRVRVALSRKVAVIAAGIPPVHVFGITPRLVALGIEWEMADTGEWRLALHAHGQTGTITGAFTCPDEVLGAPPGSAGNPTGCNARSSDAATLRYGAIEFEAARRFKGAGNLMPHLTIALNGIDSRFDVNALAFGHIDHTRLQTRGTTWSASFGAYLPLGPRLAVVADAFYTPLFVRRDAAGPRSNDGLFNVRGVVSYRIR